MDQKLKISGRAILFLVAASSLRVVTSAQSLADVAKKTEEERAKTKQGQPAPVFTNKDLVDVPRPGAAASGKTGTAPAKSASDETIGAFSAVEDQIRDQTATQGPPACDKSSAAAIRVNRIPGINGDAVETWLALVLRGRRQDQLPINLAFRAVHDDQSRSNTPREVTLEFTLSPNIGGPFDFKPPHVVFVVDDGQASAGTVEYSINGQPLVTMGISSVSIEPFALADLARLERATTLRGRLFNIEFALTPEQICSIREFSQRARQRPNKPGAVF